MPLNTQTINCEINFSFLRIFYIVKKVYGENIVEYNLLL